MRGAEQKVNALNDELRQRERELTRERELAEARSRAKTELLAHVSHEMRTPMNAVLGFSDILARSPLRPEQARLDWAAAVSILGHETMIKDTYAYLLSQPGRKFDVFLDAGANYGTHSLLFAASGVTTLDKDRNASKPATIIAVKEGKLQFLKTVAP